MFKEILAKLGFKECMEYNLSIWHCPSFLFFIIGVINAVSILTTYSVTRVYDSPELVIISAVTVSLFVFILGFAVIQGVEKITSVNKMRNEFVSIASHQLKTPLSGLRWACDILQNPVTGSLNAKQEGYVEDMQQHISRMVRLSNDLLDVNKIDSGQMVINLRSVDLVAVAEDAIRELTYFATANNISIVLRTKGRKRMVETDPVRIKMVIENLIDNAIKYIGGNNKKGKIIVRIEFGLGEVRCEVKDNGIGISDKEQKQIFDKFFRAGDNTKKQIIGTGLGLYIAKATVKNSKGNIGVMSEINKGSTFWFTLPIVDKKTK